MPDEKKDERVTIKLKDPITVGSQVIEELHMRKPRAKDLRRMPLTPNLGDMLDLAGALSGQPRVIIDELSIADVTEVSNFVGSFWESGPKTGDTSSP